MVDFDQRDAAWRAMNDELMRDLQARTPASDYWLNYAIENYRNNVFLHPATAHVASYDAYGIAVNEDKNPRIGLNTTYIARDIPPGTDYNKAYLDVMRHELRHVGQLLYANNSWEAREAAVAANDLEGRRAGFDNYMYVIEAMGLSDRDYTDPHGIEFINAVDDVTYGETEWARDKGLGRVLDALQKLQMQQEP